MALLFGICLVLAGASQAASFSRITPSLAPRLKGNELIDAFIDSLSLQTEQVQVVHDYLVKDNNLDAYLGNGSYNSTQLAATACGTLEILLGRDSVDTSPVNETVVQESWYVNSVVSHVPIECLQALGRKQPGCHQTVHLFQSPKRMCP
jgi:hypothetical protein